MKGESAQTTLDEEEHLELAYPGEVRLVRDEGADEQHRYRFDAPGRPSWYFAESGRRNGRLFATLFAALDGFRIDGVGSEGVPVTVAAAGKSAVYVYLQAEFGESPRAVARRFDVDRDSVWRANSRVRERAPEPVHDARE